MHKPTENQLESAKRYIVLFENMSHPLIDEARHYVADTMVFEDPFNRVENLKDFQGLLHHGLDVMTAPKFHITNQSWDGDILFVRWNFKAGLPVIGHWSFTGMSAITISAEGMVLDHIDYWDSGRFFYALIPVIGPIIRMLRKKAAYKA